VQLIFFNLRNLFNHVLIAVLMHILFVAFSVCFCSICG